MSFLREVLVCNEEAQVINIKEKMPLVVSQINKLKYEVKTYMENADVRFINAKDKNMNLLKQATNLNEEMTILKSKIQEVTRTDLINMGIELESLKAEYEETSYALEVASRLVSLNEAFEKQKQMKSERKFLEAAEQIAVAREIIENIPAEERLCIMDTFNSVGIIEARQELLNLVGNAWREIVVLDKQEKEDETTVVVKIEDELQDLEQILQTLYREKDLNPINKLSDFLLSEILKPIIDKQIKMEVIDTSLEIKILNKSSKMDYKSVFDHIRTVFDYFSLSINYKLEDFLLLGYIGNKIRNDFCEYFIKNCLADTVPLTPDGLEKYTEVVDEIKLLQDMLTECQFLDSETSSILHYAGNVDVLFANKICQNYHQKAIAILKKDLHDMIEVGEEVPTNSQQIEMLNAFPKCCVSRSACEYLNLARLILDQATTSSEMCAGRLLYTAKQIFDLYCDLIPEYHRKLLESIPQQVALFHNNCMYLSHELISFGQFYFGKLPKIITTGDSFDNQIQFLRSKGTDVFLKYMRYQIKQNESIISDSDLANLSQKEELDPACEKSIRQCLRQLEILKTVWQNVLSYEIYNKSIGQLLNAFINYLITLVLKVEDISANTSHLLVEMFKIIQNRGPKLFTDSKEINLYVKQWYKFTEMIMLLSSSLSDINDRWANGKGPLAMEYSPEDVRKLIRALFQNTDLRSAVLSKIY